MKYFLVVGLAIATLAIAALVLRQFDIGPKISLNSQDELAAGWDDAKEDFMSQYMAIFTEEFADFRLPAQAIQKIAQCTTEKSIVFLNTTDCPYLYDETTTSEAQHLQSQEECFLENGYEAKEEEFSVACMKDHFPDDWKHVKWLIQEMYAAGLIASGVEAEQARILATCMTDQTISVVQKRGCHLINRQARRAEQLLFTIDDCIEDPDNDAEYQAALESCRPKEESPANTADTA